MARSVTPYRSGGLLGGLDDIFSLHREVNRLFDSMTGQAGPGAQAGQPGAIMSARLNVSETDAAIRVTAEMPGVAEDDIDVSLDDDVLTIRGEAKAEERGERERVHFVERSFGTFQRSLRLPFPVDPEQVRAEFRNGVLSVTLPKAAQVERSRRIPVQRGGGQAIGSQGAAGAQPMGGHVGTLEGGQGEVHDSGQGGQGGAEGSGSMGGTGP